VEDGLERDVARVTESRWIAFIAHPFSAPVNGPRGDKSRT